MNCHRSNTLVYRARTKDDPVTMQLSFGEFGKMVAERWEKLPEPEKAKLQVCMCIHTDSFDADASSSDVSL